MYLSAVIINTVAICFPFISMIIYARLLLAIFGFKTIKKIPELSLFYFKFGFDLTISVTSFTKLVLYAFAMTSLVDYLKTNHYLTFFIIWPNDAISQMRAILLFFIALDRTFATYFPIKFFLYRKIVSTIFILTIVLSYWGIDASVMFLYCKVDLSTPTEAISGKGVQGPCYSNYWLRFQQTFYFLIIALTILLILKLFFLSNKQNISWDLRRANRLAMIDCGIMIVFDLLPSSVGAAYPNFFDYVGALSTVAKTLGFVVESILVTINLQQKYQSTKPANSTGNVMVRPGKSNSSVV